MSYVVLRAADLSVVAVDLGTDEALHPAPHPVLALLLVPHQLPQENQMLGVTQQQLQMVLLRAAGTRRQRPLRKWQHLDRQNPALLLIQERRLGLRCSRSQ